MPKHEPMTPKAIANRIKAKGLQKLRWYCQMCNKQCRDQNGFKCHLTSEAHQRQLLLFAENSGRFMSDFSSDFEKGYMDILRRQFGTKRVHCNVIYSEYIKDRNHIHMNSTRWYTLTGFVNYLGKTGICKVDHTEKGWYIQYIDREEEKRQERLAKKQKMDQDDEERITELVMKQAEKALEQEAVKKANNGDEDELENAEKDVKREFEKPDDVKIEFKLPKTSLKDNSAFEAKKNLLKPKLIDIKPEKRSHTDDEDKPSTSHAFSSKDSKSQKKRSVLDEIKLDEEARKEKQNRKDYWLFENIIVKIVTKKLGDEFFNKKALVEKVEDNYTAYVSLIGKSDKNSPLLKLDQNHLQTVLPNIGRKVLVVNGAYRGQMATMENVNEKQDSVSIRIDKGTLKGRLVENVPYEDVCKWNG